VGRVGREIVLEPGEIVEEGNGGFGRSGKDGRFQLLRPDISVDIALKMLLNFQRQPEVVLAEFV
jgi:hypothetical protein